MDSIRQAVERARAAESTLKNDAGGFADFAGMTRQEPFDQVTEVLLDQAHLESTRIVAHGTSNQEGRCYDMLRTQVLQELDQNGWRFLAVTSPTAGCGKTVTACNLAMSIARLPGRSVFLVDLDLRKPMVAKYLGLQKGGGVLSVLENPATLSAAMLQVGIDQSRFLVLPGSEFCAASSEWMASQTMEAVLKTIKRDFRTRVVVFDLPPLLLSDDVISILPRMDAALLVTSVGNTSISDIKECQRHLRRTPVVRVVVNKATETAGSYYGYY